MKIIYVILMFCNFYGTFFCWNIPKLIPQTFDNVMFPSIAVTPRNQIHLVYMKSTDLNYGKGEIYYLNGTLLLDDVNWGIPRKLCDIECHRNSPPKVVIGSDNTVHVAFGDSKNLQIYYLYNSFYGVGNFDIYLVATIKSSFNVAITLNDDNLPIISFGTGVGNRSSRLWMTFPSSTKNFQSWNLVQYSYYVYFARAPSLIAKGSGASTKIHILFEQMDNISTQFYIAHSWGSLTKMETSENFSSKFGTNNGMHPNIILGPSNVYAIFVEGSTKEDYRMYFVWSKHGIQWSSPMIIKQGQNIWPAEPKMTLSQNEIVISLTQKWWNGEFVNSYQIQSYIYNVKFNTLSQPSLVGDVGQSCGQSSIAAGMFSQVDVWVVNNTQALLYNVQSF